jgi:hypothetical protein
LPKTFAAAVAADIVAETWAPGPAKAFCENPKPQSIQPETIKVWSVK